MSVRRLTKLMSEGIGRLFEMGNRELMKISYNLIELGLDKNELIRSEY